MILVVCCAYIWHCKMGSRGVSGL